MANSLSYNHSTIWVGSIYDITFSHHSDCRVFLLFLIKSDARGRPVRIQQRIQQKCMYLSIEAQGKGRG